MYFSLSSNRNKIVDFVHRRDWTRVNGVIVNVKEIRGSTWFDRNQLKKQKKKKKGNDHRKWVVGGLARNEGRWLGS